MSNTDSIFYIIILIISIIIHEISHGYAALFLGDKTAKYAGRLTLNPLRHLDLFGSIIIPLFLIVTKAGFIFGWAKPVPYNPNNLRNKKWGPAIVASAGIIANLTIAIIFSLIIRVALVSGYQGEGFFFITSIIVLLNLLLAFFNLMPIPPLDGSKILFAFLPYRFRKWEMFLERYSFIFVIIFVVFVWKYFAPVIFSLFHLLTGINTTL